MADVTTLRAGRWAFSRPLIADGAWTTFAQVQRLAPTIAHYFPPKVAGVPALNAVLVRLVGPVTAPTDGNTILFPRDITATDMTLAELTAGQRNALQATLTSWLPGYSFTDPVEGPRVIAPFSDRIATFTGQTTLRAVALDVLRHFGHSASRSRPTVIETHNTEFVDDFDTDPYSAPRWVNDSGSAAWDAGNGELDLSMAGVAFIIRYSANGPGSIEHEAQVTGIAGDNRMPGPAVRMDDTGADDCYTLEFTDDNNVTFIRINAGGTPDLLQSTASGTWTTGDWYTRRLAASGAVGANVDLAIWSVDHNTSKPSLGGSGNWQGVDGSPDLTYTDTDANRLDGTNHSQCGIGGRSSSNSDYDTRLDFWKERAISDRAGSQRRFILH